MSGTAPPLLLQNVRSGFGQELADVRLRDGVVAAIGATLQPLPGEVLIDGRGGSLFPGLRDHHVHLRALAAALLSTRCGPPEVTDAAALAKRLGNENRRSRDWLRGIAYHERVAGAIDRDWLDRHAPDRPVRIQHRSGRLWIMNSAALERLGPIGPADPLERCAGRLTGRLFDADGWLHRRLRGAPVSLVEASRRLAAHGVTAVTDATPSNDSGDADCFAACQAGSELLQRVCMMGGPGLETRGQPAMLSRGATKLHLHEHDLPDLQHLTGVIETSHARGRTVAAHCVTATELAFFIAALRCAGPMAGDRIEHAAVVGREWLEVIEDTGVTVVTQPGFVRERGDQYLQDLPADDISGLYRLKSFAERGIPLAAGSDASFGDPNPWRAMQTATDRRTLAGVVIGAAEALTPEAACELYLGDLHAPGGGVARIEAGATADLCLLERDWHSVRGSLADTCVRLTVRGGRVIWDARRDSAGEAMSQAGSGGMNNEPRAA